MTFGTHDYSGTAVPITKYPKQRAWSFSTVQQHTTCPQVIRFRKIDRLDEPKSEHLQRGLDVHGAVEYVIGSVEGALMHQLPFSLEWLPLFNSLRLAEAMCEVKAAFTKDWQLTGYFDPDVWVRVVLDAIVVDDHVTVWEWKTGKVYEEHKKQKRLYALAGLLLYPTSEVDVRIRYLDRPPTHADNADKSVLSVNVADLSSLKAEFVEFSHDYLNDEIYPARPNRFCGWCHFRKTNGGPCSYG